MPTVQPSFNVTYDDSIPRHKHLFA
jgi:hypothetical protein